ncbi:MAG: ABC transporter ATP-binding protein [Propionibacteriaceae bacterium]|nr:ABC transporter ATP-binding protein [Propionibacteriaceae bacterium]
MASHYDVILRSSGLGVSLGGRRVLSCVDLAIAPQEIVAVQGTSGSGKTTLLRVLAGIQLPDVGTVMFDDENLTAMSDEQRSALRLREFGFVFQFGDLVPELTLWENIALPLEFLGVPARDRKDRVDELVRSVGLDRCCEQLPHTVSGGERQRAAVARALVHRPHVVFADEPTGSLDTAARDTVLSMLASMAQQFACALFVVTHDPWVAHQCDRIVELVDGRLVEHPR